MGNSIKVGDTIYVVMTTCNAPLEVRCRKKVCNECQWQHTYIDVRKVHNESEIEEMKKYIDVDIFGVKEDAENEVRRRGKMVTYSGL